ncbi:hypothetical protein [Photorhabdus cinerea]|uniref:Uncharacterized protein n=1 Tax=Photorhabdus cinerea TaxID=471575 RepID=A0A7X5QCJ9_9GAMM|nr:hypothetical protein [Photorhabdus cinerea]NHB91747.1 hypothetical protein [Photorhabdus cinerea]
MQIIYNWKQLESASGKYDFSAIEKDLMLLSKIQKKLFIQIQDRFFERNVRYTPSYLQQDTKYQGGLVSLIIPVKAKHKAMAGLLFSGIHRVAQTLPEFAFCANKRI